MGEIDAVLTSTTRGQQVDEVAHLVYADIQTLRQESDPGGKVNRLFVSPNMGKCHQCSTDDMKMPIEC